MIRGLNAALCIGNANRVRSVEMAGTTRLELATSAVTAAP